MSMPLQEIAFRLPGPLCDLQALHQAVWSLVRGSPAQQRDFLFSFAEQGTTLGIIIRSRYLPDRLAEHSKPLPPANTGKAYRFALRANPVRRYADPSGNRITQALQGDEDLYHWLCQQGMRHGFQPQADALSLLRRKRLCTPSRGQPYVINDVLFRGILSVGAPRRLQQALENGIGRSKAFGYGMLLLTPINNANNGDTAYG